MHWSCIWFKGVVLVDKSIQVCDNVIAIWNSDDTPHWLKELVDSGGTTFWDSNTPLIKHLYTSQKNYTKYGV